MSEQSGLLSDVTSQTTAESKEVTFEDKGVELGKEANTAFIDQLPEDLRSEGCFKNIQDLNGLAKSYMHAQKMIGSSIRIPGEDASREAREEFYSKLSQVPGVAKLPDPENVEDLNRFYNSLGRPEDPSGYKYEMPEGLSLDGGLISEFNKVAHESGLSQSAAKNIIDWYSQHEQKQLEVMQENRKQAETQLRSEWGQEYDNRLGMAKSAMQHYMEKYPEQAKEIVNGPMGNNPALLQMLSDLGRNLSEQGVIQGSNTSNFGLTPEEARDKISEIRGNKEHAFNDSSNPNHGNAVKKMQELYAIAYSG